MIVIHIFSFCLDYCKNKEQNSRQSKFKILEILVIWYATTGASAVVIFALAIIFMPTHAAFPFSYAYKAYLDNYAGELTVIRGRKDLL